ncbi:MAG: type I methionyl aminopeptidase [Propionibacteriaceae bacterium]|jgi:methionyl aminopeptidase|nr:type I methionyl aminopeptidase [Propionibacteriaceae bacterium]
MTRAGAIEVRTPEELLLMRRAGLVVAHALKAMAEAARPGVTTADLDTVARDVLEREGAASNFLGYAPGWGVPPFPATVCTSVDEVVVHGVPGPRVIADGDLVSIDFGAVKDGFHGDAAVTVAVGAVEPAAARLSEVTREALWAGVGAARLGGTIGDISHAIQKSVQRAGRYGILREFTGHGIGTQMHLEPDVPNFGRPHRGPQLVEGMCLAIEPMVTLSGRKVVTLDDDWTVVTANGNWAAHWEHSVTVTKRGVWVLTAEDGGEADLVQRGLPFGPLAD